MCLQTGRNELGGTSQGNYMTREKVKRTMETKFPNGNRPQKEDKPHATPETIVHCPVQILYSGKSLLGL